MLPDQTSGRARSGRRRRARPEPSRPSRAIPKETRTEVTSYDSSGQVYTEVTVRALDPLWDWPSKTRGSPSSLFYHENPGPGVSSLIDITIRSLLASSPHITPAIVRSLPCQLAERIWSRIVGSELDSLQVWQAFAASYPDVAPSVKRRLQRIRSPRGYPLQVFTEPLICNRADWLSLLTLQDVHVTRRALIHDLAKMSNLVALTIGEDVSVDPGIAVDDGIFRAWASHSDAFAANVLRKVANTGDQTMTAPFGRLRILSMRSQPYFTIRALEHLVSLPRLSLINLEGCGVGIEQFPKAEKLGWDRLPCHETGTPLFLKPADSTLYTQIEDFVPASLAFLDSRDEASKDSRPDERTVESQLPTVHLILGQNEVTRTNAWSGVDGRGAKLVTFVRNPMIAGSKLDHQVANLKRVLKESRNGSNSPPRKKSRPRPSKMQDFSDLLKDFEPITASQF